MPNASLVRSERKNVYRSSSIEHFPINANYFTVYLTTSFYFQKVRMNLHWSLLANNFMKLEIRSRITGQSGWNPGQTWSKIQSEIHSKIQSQIWSQMLKIQSEIWSQIQSKIRHGKKQMIKDAKENKNKMMIKRRKDKKGGKHFFCSFISLFLLKWPI